MSFKSVDSKQPFPKIEEEILEFWQKNKIFEKSLDKNPKTKPYVFYDGPPFATGLPHYGHILSSVIKDVVPRYWTMKGYYVRRRWGWDCHGLPIENICENEFKTNGKKDIEGKLGIAKFNSACRSKVLTYTSEWKKMIDRIGRWVEFDNAYKTMDSTYMESVWWALKSIWDKGLIYEGKKVLMYCPRCETPISKAEVAMDNSYKDIDDFSTIFKFKVKGEDNTYFLAWSTTPWNKLVTYALAVNPKIKYVKVKEGKEYYILAKSRLNMLKSQDIVIIKEMFGKDLAGIDYEPLYDFDYDYQGKRVYYVITADFVSDDEGTGIVTIAPYGEEDMEAIKDNDLPVVLHLDSTGRLMPVVTQWAGMYYRDADPLIIKDLESRNLIYSTKKEKHNYPFCWRCDTQLYYNPISAWFIDIQKIKSRLIELNEKINWFPKHLKHGRFLNILKTAPDWNISRNRYWATPLPFWKCDDTNCNHVECIGSVKELKEKAINFNDVYESDEVEMIDLHKDKMDQIKLKCAKCGQKMIRVPEVIDCWVESASMPFAEFHYPFENKEVFKNRFPGQYIAEYIAQTRAWFYYMHVMSTLLFDNISYENCVTTGTILNEKGEKLSKSKMNYTDPWKIIDQYGVDTMRYYLMSSVVMQADNLLFNDNEVKDIHNKVINILRNVVVFYQTFRDNKLIKSSSKEGDDQISNNILDKWIITKLSDLSYEVTKQMDNYNTVKATRPIKDFIDELSTWWLRRSRDRLKSDDNKIKSEAISTLHYVLLELSKIIAPFTPFLAEFVYSNVGGKGASVHLEEWPILNEKLKTNLSTTLEAGNEKLLEDMQKVREIVEKVHAIRAEKGLKVRQPLAKLKLQITNYKLQVELLKIIAEEVNVKKVEFADIKEELELDTNITPELRQEGLMREFVRQIQSLRKNIGLTPKDKINIYWQSDNEDYRQAINKFQSEILAQTLAQKVESTIKDELDYIDLKDLKIAIEKIL